jgi:hypothetical protein
MQDGCSYKGEGLEDAWNSCPTALLVMNFTLKAVSYKAEHLSYMTLGEL